MKTTTLRQRKQMGSRFRRFREKHGFTQGQLSKLIELHRTEISWIENGKRFPYHSTLERFHALELRLQKGHELHAASKKGK